MRVNGQDGLIGIGLKAQQGELKELGRGLGEEQINPVIGRGNELFVAGRAVAQQPETVDEGRKRLLGSDLLVNQILVYCLGSLFDLWFSRETSGNGRLPSRIGLKLWQGRFTLSKKEINGTIAFKESE